MKKRTLFLATVAMLLIFPKLNFGQAPDLGDASSFAVFASSGAFTNVGASIVTGNVGNNAGAFTAFPPGELDGQIHNIDAVSQQAATSLTAANSAFIDMACETTIDPAMGNNQVLTPGVYCQAAVTTLTGNLTLDAQGNPNALFIIKLESTFTTAAASTITLTNSASLCNVYWHVVGAVVLGTNSSFGGTIISNGAVTLNDGAVLSGRALTTAGAISLTNTVVSVVTIPEASIISTEESTTFCSGESIVLSGNVNGTWNNEETTSELTVNTTGNYYVTNSNLFCSIESNHINVQVNPLPEAKVGENRVICKGENVTLGANALIGSTYEWTPEDGLSSATLSNPVADPSETTTYLLTETITNTGCFNTDSVTITVDNILDTSVITASGPTTFCGNEYVVLSGSIGGIWSNTGSISTPSLTVNTSGNYYVTNTNACNTVVSNHIIITVNPQPAAETGGDVSICDGNIASLGAASTPGHTYSWTPAIGLNSATSAHPYANPLISTIYTLIETDTVTTCSNSNSVIVTVTPLPPAITIDNTAICVGESEAIGGNSTSGNAYLWSPAIDLNSSTISNPIASPTDVITYTLVETISATGCSKSNSLTVFVNTPPTIIAQPNNQEVMLDSPAEFSVKVIETGTDYTYQWRRGLSDLINGDNIFGVDTDSLTIIAVTLADTSDNYNVVIAGICSTNTTSQNASLSIAPTTSIISSNIKTTPEIVNIFPNPFSSSINIVVNDISQTDLTICFYNILGVQVMDKTLVTGLNIVETVHLNQGVYIYYVKNKGKVLQYGKLVSGN
jgi:hypothetical protein